MKDNGDNYMDRRGFKFLKEAEIIVRTDLFTKQRLGHNCFCYYDKSKSNFALIRFSKN